MDNQKIIDEYEKFRCVLNEITYPKRDFILESRPKLIKAIKSLQPDLIKSILEKIKKKELKIASDYENYRSKAAFNFPISLKIGDVQKWISAMSSILICHFNDNSSYDGRILPKPFTAHFRNLLSYKAKIYDFLFEKEKIVHELKEEKSNLDSILKEMEIFIVKCDELKKLCDETIIENNIVSRSISHLRSHSSSFIYSYNTIKNERKMTEAHIDYINRNY